MKLELINISFGFSEPLVKKGEMLLESGDVCLLIGDNGVGKTTLFKSILGQNKLLSGEILLDDENISSLNSKEIAKKIAIVLSQPFVPNNFTVFDLISFGKYIHYPYYFKLSNEDLEEIEKIIVHLKLEPYRNFLLSDLSDGNLQKAFIGRALAQNSSIILLDEPTTHLDEKNKLMILNLLRSIAKNEQKIILFSSHDWRLAKEFSDKISIIENQILDTNIAEEILLAYPKLTSGFFYNFNSDFVSPEIFAPDLQKELLYSFLQKNYPKNLSNIQFLWEDGFWDINLGNSQYKVQTFQEISNILSK